MQTKILPYPNSFLKLLLLGFGIAALPLVLALVDGFLALQQLASRAEHGVTAGVTVTRDSRTIATHISGLERLARQQIVLGDIDLRNAYIARRGSLLETADRLGLAVPERELAQTLARLREEEQAVWNILEKPVLSPSEADAVIDHFNTMTEQGARLTREADALIEANLASLRTDVQGVRRRMLIQLLALVPVGGLLVAGLILLIRRPIRQLAVGIRQLGEGELDTPIDVRGPRDLELLGAELNWLRGELAEVDAQKTRFLRHVSHELKTPLTAIHEGAHLLAEGVAGPLSTEQTEITAILRKNIDRLTQHIENLINYSNLRFRPEALKLEDVSLETLFAELETDQKLALAARRLRLHRRAGPLHVRVDKERLRVALDNLLSNAIKYAPEGSDILLCAHRQDEEVLIELSDTGPGIPVRDTERMFEPFVQGEPPAQAPVKGSGLGLSIVRELVNAHQGRVSLHQNAPMGTLVRVALPQAMAGAS